MTPSAGQDVRHLWPPTFKAAIFDFDGTIATTAPLWHEVDRAFLGARGIAMDVEYSRRLNILGFAAGARYTIERYGLPESVEDVCLEWERMARALYETRATLRPGAYAYIRALRDRGVPVALATTNGRGVLDAMRSVDLDEIFDVRVHAGELGVTKDEPDIYLRAAELLQASPSSCIVFEDILAAARSARRAGALVCGVRSGDANQDPHELRSNTDLWLDDWRDIAPVGKCA
ncbi:HAD family hydrolase [Olsenella massiliensis]|uniref:HAD family hydrolase n=1 Tax=Olsenella massiliensis TaxID=1622075 RepID=UPI00071D9830|nr:HAD family phosphatase [Olsenella massiliensis]